MCHLTFLTYSVPFLFISVKVKSTNVQKGQRSKLSLAILISDTIKRSRILYFGQSVQCEISCIIYAPHLFYTKNKGIDFVFKCDIVII